MLMKAKKRTKKPVPIDIKEISSNYQIVSEIESYSILEKI